MKLEDSPPALKALGEKALAICEWLAGEPAIYRANWYKVGSPIFAELYLIGEAAKKNPANSIRITAAVHSAELEAVSHGLGNNMHGHAVPEFVVKSGDADSFADFLVFIGQAFRARRDRSGR
ncbi:MAG: hypothetical protein IPM20_14235 [Gammaproteobacteria bacterium]|nr:hypothetical protein [Gammaproteobacteria bacterium]